MFDSLERTSQTLFPHTPKRAGRPPPPSTNTRTRFNRRYLHQANRNSEFPTKKSTNIKRVSIDLDGTWIIKKPSFYQMIWRKVQGPCRFFKVLSSTAHSTRNMFQRRLDCDLINDAILEAAAMECLAQLSDDRSLLFSFLPSSMTALPHSHSSTGKKNSTVLWEIQTNARNRARAQFLVLANEKDWID